MDIPELKPGDRVRHRRSGPGTVRDLMFDERRLLLSGVVWSQLSLVDVEFDDGLSRWVNPGQLVII